MKHDLLQARYKNIFSGEPATFVNVKAAVTLLYGFPNDWAIYYGGREIVKLGQTRGMSKEEISRLIQATINVD